MREHDAYNEHMFGKPIVRAFGRLLNHRTSTGAIFDPTNPMIVEETATGWRYTPWRAAWWTNYWFYLLIVFVVCAIVVYTTPWAWEKLVLSLIATATLPALLAGGSTIKRQLTYDRDHQTWTYQSERGRLEIPVGVIHAIEVEEVMPTPTDSLPSTFAARVQYFNAEGELQFFRIGSYGFQPQAVVLVRWLQEQAQAVAPFMKVEEAVETA